MSVDLLLAWARKAWAVVVWVRGLFGKGASTTDESTRMDTGGETTRPSAPPSGGRAPAANSGRFELTNYWIVSLDDPSTWQEYRGDGLGQIAIVGLGKRSYPPAFLKATRMEGSARIPEGVLNYDGAAYVLLDPKKYPWGRGASGRGVVPFRSVAVDRSLIPLGTWLTIDELVGFMLPDGTVHDGRVRADDTGGRIKGPHLDWYVGLKKHRQDAMHPREVTVRWPTPA